MTSNDTNRLRQCVEALRTQLDEIPSPDPAAVARLRATLADIEAAIASQGASSAKGAGASIAHRLTAAAREFEDSHPALTGALGSVIDALGRMGI
jgi:hypothetical protein